MTPSIWFLLIADCRIFLPSFLKGKTNYSAITRLLSWPCNYNSEYVAIGTWQYRANFMGFYGVGLECKIFIFWTLLFFYWYSLGFFGVVLVVRYVNGWLSRVKFPFGIIMSFYLVCSFFWLRYLYYATQLQYLSLVLEFILEVKCVDAF